MEHKDIINCMNDLIETCKDGEYGFRTTAEHASSSDLRQLFAARANECRDAASELQSLVMEHGGKASDSGSASGAVHRGWVAVKAKLSGYSDLALLEECERGEDVAMARYRKALEEALPAAVRQIAQRQYEGVKRNHSQIRSLRDHERVKA